MSRKKRQTGAQKPVRTRDGYNNFAAKLGGYTSNIQSGGVTSLATSRVTAYSWNLRIAHRFWWAPVWTLWLMI